MSLDWLGHICDYYYYWRLFCLIWSVRTEAKDSSYMFLYRMILGLISLLRTENTRRQVEWVSVNELGHERQKTDVEDYRDNSQPWGVVLLLINYCFPIARNSTNCCPSHLAGIPIVHTGAPVYWGPTFSTTSIMPANILSLKTLWTKAIVGGNDTAV